MRGDTHYSQPIKPSQRLCNTQVSKWNDESGRTITRIRIDMLVVLSEFPALSSWQKSMIFTLLIPIAESIDSSGLESLANSRDLGPQEAQTTAKWEYGIILRRRMQKVLRS